MQQYHLLSAAELLKQIKAGELSVEELTRYYLKRIETFDQKLNTIAELNPNVIAQAKEMDAAADKSAPLFGLPMLIKDNIDIAGMHTAAGSLALKDHVAQTDAPVVAALKKAGALILGKTNMTEFANYTTDDMPNGFSSRGGQVYNAYDPKKDPSGSSTGSGVAMSAGFCAAAIGTDTSFSIVGCSEANGVIGFKPTHGNLPTDGIVPISHTLDTAGPITKTVEDAILVYAALRGEQPDLTATPADRIRLAASTVKGWEEQSEQEKARFAEFFDALKAAGASVEPLAHTNSGHAYLIMRYEFKHDLEQYLNGTDAKYQTLKEIVDFYEADASRMPYGITVLRMCLDHSTGKMDDPEYLEVMKESLAVKAALTEELRDFDACVMMEGTSVPHFVGFPSIALRMCYENGWPYGAILFGPDEKKLLAAALTIEKFAKAVPMPEL